MNLSLKESIYFSYDFINNQIYVYESYYDPCIIYIPIICTGLTYANDTPFEYIGNISQVVPLSHIKNDKIYFFVSLTKNISDFNDSSIISIQPYLMVYKNIDIPITFMAITHEDKSQRYSNDCDKPVNVIKGSGIEGLFDIYIDGYQFCKSFNFFNLGTSVIRFVKKNEQNSFVIIQFTVTKDDINNFYICKIEYPHNSSNVVIKNNIENTVIYVHQFLKEKIDGFVYHPMVFKYKDELLYAKEQPFIDKKYYINVKFGDNKCYHQLTFDKDCHSKKIEKTNYYYDVKRRKLNDDDDNHNTDIPNIHIVIYKKKSGIESTDSQGITEEKIKSFSISIKEIELSYIDKKMNELFLSTIKKAQFKYTDEIITFKINGFALNDMYTASVSPVVLHGKEEPFLYLEIDLDYPINTLIFDEIKINLKPIEIFVDFVFLGDLYASFKEILNYSNQLRNNRRNKNFVLKKFSVNSISISELSFDLYASYLQDRKYRFKHYDYYNLLHFKIPYFNQINFIFKQIEQFNVEATMIDFLKSLSDNYKKQILFKDVIRNLLKNFKKLPTSKSFDDFLNFKSKINNNKYNNNNNSDNNNNNNSDSNNNINDDNNKSNNDIDNIDIILEYPRRLPRAFPKDEILDAPSYSEVLSSNYHDNNTDIQYRFQKLSNGEYCNEKLHEVVELADKSKLAFFDNYLFFICYKDSNSNFEINYEEIKNIEIDNENLTIFNNNNNKILKCKSNQDAISIKELISAITQKINLFKQ